MIKSTLQKCLTALLLCLFAITVSAEEEATYLYENTDSEAFAALSETSPEELSDIAEQLMIYTDSLQSTSQNSGAADNKAGIDGNTASPEATTPFEGMSLEEVIEVINEYNNTTKTPKEIQCKSYQRTCEKYGEKKCCLNTESCAENAKKEIGCGIRCQKAGTSQCVVSTNPDEFKCCGVNTEICVAKSVLIEGSKPPKRRLIPECVPLGDVKPPKPGGKTCQGPNGPWFCALDQNCGNPQIGARNACCAAHSYFDRAKQACVPVGTQICVDANPPAPAELCKYNSTCCSKKIKGEGLKTVCCDPIAEICDTSDDLKGCIHLGEPVPNPLATPTPTPTATPTWVPLLPATPTPTPGKPKVACKIVFYTTTNCNPCEVMKKQLDAAGINYGKPLLNGLGLNVLYPQLHVTCGDKSRIFTGGQGPDAIKFISENEK